MTLRQILKAVLLAVCFDSLLLACGLMAVAVPAALAYVTGELELILMVLLIAKISDRQNLRELILNQ